MIKPPTHLNLTGRVYLLEIILGLGLITVVNLLFFRATPGFLDVAPHPYWLIIVPIASRYGFKGGLWSGLIAATLFFSFKVLSIPDISIVEIKAVEVWGTPVLFIAGAFVIGEIRQVHINAYNEQLSLVEELKATMLRLQEQYDVMVRAKEEVDTRIVSQEQTMSTLYEATQAMRSLNQDDIYPAILDLLQDYLKAEECSIYIVEDGRLMLKGAYAKEGNEVLPELSLEEGMAARAVATKTTQTINAALLNKGEVTDSLIAAPITDVSENNVVGVLVVQKMPFVKFTANNIQVATLIADWCGASLDNATLYHETRDKLIAEDAISAYRFEYLKQRLAEEFYRARRYKLDLSLIILDFPDLATIESKKDLEEALVQISVLLKQNIRNIDLLFTNDHAGSFVLVLPTTGPEGARIVARNMAKLFRAMQMDQGKWQLKSVKTRMAAYTDDLDEPMDLYERASEKAEYVRTT